MYARICRHQPVLSCLSTLFSQKLFAKPCRKNQRQKEDKGISMRHEVPLIFVRRRRKYEN